MRLIRPGPSPPLPSSSSSPPSPVKQTGHNFSFVTGSAPISPNQLTYPFNGPANPNPAPERQQPCLDGTASGSMIESRRVSLSRLRSRSDASIRVTNAVDKKDKPIMSLAFAGLLVYTVGVKWRGLNKKEQYEASHVISLGERRANKIIKEARNDLIAHNRTHLIRSYPAGTRFTSSNYLPQHFWAVGVQMVALNWQTYDLGSEINAALFQRNSRSGYILKPEILRKKRSLEKDKEILGREERYILVIDILSAQQLPRPREGESSAEDGSIGGNGGLGNGSSISNIVNNNHSSNLSKNTNTINPFIEVAIFTAGTQTSEQAKFRTRIVYGNGFNPVFDSQFRITFSVPPDMLDLAFLRLKVIVKYGGEEISLGKYTVSLPVLMPGKRVLLRSIFLVDLLLTLCIS